MAVAVTVSPETGKVTAIDLRGAGLDGDAIDLSALDALAVLDLRSNQRLVLPWNSPQMHYVSAEDLRHRSLELWGTDLESERRILSNLHSLMGGVSWTNSSHWSDEVKSVTWWHGCSTMLNTRRGLSVTVTELDLSKNNLTGQIPPRLRDGLPNLQRLDFSHNRIEGLVPLLADIPSLTYLDLSIMLA